MNTSFSHLPVKAINGYLYRLVNYNFYKEEVYAPEHVLVMEARIGRRLKINEYVQHINDIWGDNRDENLTIITSKSIFNTERLNEYKISKRVYYKDGRVYKVIPCKDIQQDSKLKELKEYLKTHTLMQASKKFGVSTALINTLINKYDLRDKLKEIEPISDTPHMPTKEQLLEDFEQGLTNIQMSVKYNISKEKIIVVKNSYGITKGLKVNGIKNIKKMKENIITSIDDILTLGQRQAAYKYNVSLSSISNFLKDYKEIYDRVKPNSHVA